MERVEHVRAAFKASQEVRQQRIEEAEARLRALNESLADRVKASQAAADERAARAEKLRITLRSVEDELATHGGGGVDASTSTRGGGHASSTPRGADGEGEGEGLVQSSVIVHMDVEPRRVESYNKETQTDESGLFGSKETTGEGKEGEGEQGGGKNVVEGEGEGEGEGEEEEESLDAAIAAVEKAIAELKPGQVEAMTETLAFSSFFSRASRRMERSLAAEGGGLVEKDMVRGEGSPSSSSSSSKALVVRGVYGMDHKQGGEDERGVGCLDWSDAYPELFLVGYSDGYTRGNDAFSGLGGGVSPGYMELRSLALPGVPELVFRAQSPITSAAFVTHHGSLVLGGTYAGQVVLWDTRAGTDTPVASSPLGGSNHGGAVRAACVAGTANNLTLATLSTDGAFIAWSLGSLTAPAERLNLGVPAVSLAFSSSSPNSLYVGTLTGGIHGVSRHGEGKGLGTSFDHHQAAITGLSCSPHTSKMDYDLLLASSVDWSTSLWRSDMDRPIHVFETGIGYVYDVAWSPSHPSVFATATSSGSVHLWDLLASSSSPVASADLGSGLAVTSLAFSSSGLSLLAGSSSGSTALLSVDLPPVGDDAFSRLDLTLAELEQM